ncbi:hypothetical protein GQ53DRAFT_755315 [Thozetella sp. PMI_491]|nr:hypothetical protein GQ53DRAFT_755315 [Thozetella sp. PMI_491]
MPLLAACRWAEKKRGGRGCPWPKRVRVMELGDACRPAASDGLLGERDPPPSPQPAETNDEEAVYLARIRPMSGGFFDFGVPTSHLWRPTLASGGSERRAGETR